MVADWRHSRVSAGCARDEIGVFMRPHTPLKRVGAATTSGGMQAFDLSGKIDVETGDLALCARHFARGLEFWSVVVMACEDDVTQLAERIERVADDTDFEGV